MFVPPVNVSVSLARATLSFEPLSAPTVKDVVILDVDTAVIKSLALVVITGIAVELPVALVSEFTVASVIAPDDDICISF